MTKQKRAFWRGDKRFWSPIALGLGLATFFFGVLRVMPVVPISVGWVTIGCGMILLIVGFATAPLK